MPYDDRPFHPSDTLNVIDLEKIKLGILHEIHTSGLSLGEVKLHLNQLQTMILAQLSETCAHGRVEEHTTEETEYEYTDMDHFQVRTRMGVRPCSELDVLLWLLPKWMRWRRPKFQTVTAQSRHVVHNYWQKNVTRKHVTYLPRPDLALQRNHATMAGDFGAHLNQSMKDMESLMGIPMHYVDGTVTGRTPTEPKPIPPSFFAAPRGMPVRISNLVPDDEVWLMSPKTFTLVKTKLRKDSL